jgi:hypothetical protein
MAAPDDGPSTGARGAELRGGSQQETLAENRARSTAMRSEAAYERGAGASRPDPRDPSVRGQEPRAAAIDPTVLAAFTQDLLAGSDLGEMDGGVDLAEEGGDVEVEAEAPMQERRVKKARGARPPRTSHGGVEDGGDDPPEEAPVAEAPRSRSKRWPRVSARQRVRVLDLDSLLLLGEQTGVLLGWQAETVPGLVQRLPSRGFHLLWRAVDRLPSRVARLVVLQALAAHRRPEDLEPLAEALGSAEDDSVADWLKERAAERDPRARERPGAAPPPDVLQRHYDPCPRWLGEATSPLLPSEQWPIPQWIKGARREPIELCAVAFLQASRGVFARPFEDLDDAEEAEGANDPLVAALELHGESHPAVARWGVTLAARADTDRGLLDAADALLRARAIV